MLREKDTHIEKTGLKELVWFLGLWALGVVTITVIGTVIRLTIMP